MAKELEAETADLLLTCSVCSVPVDTTDRLFCYGKVGEEDAFCCEACATALGGGRLVLPSARCRECSRPLSESEPGQLNLWTGESDPRIELCGPCARKFGSEARSKGVASMLDIMDRLDDV